MEDKVLWFSSCSEVYVVTTNQLESPPSVSVIPGWGLKDWIEDYSTEKMATAQTDRACACEDMRSVENQYATTETPALFPLTGSATRGI